MDRSRDVRDDRSGRGRGSYGRDGRPARYSRNSPPLSIPLRSGYPSNSSQSYQSIPLRPAGPQRYSDSASSSAYNSPGPYYRGDAPSQLPARPVQRYRSPPLAGSSTPTSRPGWDSSRARDARGSSGWPRDDYRGDSGNSGPPSRGGGWRESDRDGWDRDRDRRSHSIGRAFSQDGAGRGGGFEVPYRQSGVDSRKRGRDSSDEDDRDDDQYSAGRSRGASSEWRGRPALSGSRDSFDRGHRTVSDNKVYPVVPGRAGDGRDKRSRRPPSPTGSDNTYEAPTVSRRASEHGSLRNSPRRARSYSPGEISEGPRRSYSPASRSRSRSRSPPPSRDGRLSALDMRRTSTTESKYRSVETTRMRLDEDSRGRPVNGRRSSSPRLDDSRPSLTSRRSDFSPRRLSLSPRRISPRRATSPLQRRPASDAGGSTPPRPASFRPVAPSQPVPLVNRIARRSSTPPRPPVSNEIVMSSVAPPPQRPSLESRLNPPPAVQHAPLPPHDMGDSPKSTSPHLRQHPTSSLPSSPQLHLVPSTEVPPIPPTQLAPSSPPLPAQTQVEPSTTPLQPVPIPLAMIDPSLDAVVHVVDPEATSPAHPPSDDRPFRLFVDMDINTEPAAATPPIQSPSPQARSPSPLPVLPMDFGSILGGIIAANERDSGDVNGVMESNRSRTEKERTSADVIRDLTNRECFSVALEAHKVIEPFLCAGFAKRDVGRGEQMVELRGQYKARNDDWQAHCRRLDRIKDRIHRRRQATTTAPVTPSIDPSGLPFFPEPMTPGPSIVGRGNRRNTNTAFGYGDAVRSEAEFLEILASLETADMRDPNVRATRTAAIVPDMVLDETERRSILAFEDDRRLVEDPVAFYSLRAPLDLWTEDEVQIFCKRFSQHPKQFGRIAAELSEKSTAQCVLFYYRMKTTIDFRSLSDRRSRDGRRRKPRRRTDGEGHAKKGASLMSNLKRARADEQEDEDDSPPPSPQMGRRNLVGESPSVFQPRESNSRPAQSTQDAAMIADLGSRSSDKKARTPKLRDTGQLGPPPSDGMLEAAEVLGALAGIASHDPDDVDGRKRDGESDAKGAARRKSTSSSYWSVAERNEFVRLLGAHGKDWNRLAEGLENKTAVQCRNWFQNHAKKLNLAEVAKNADTPFDEDDEDEHAGAGTPRGDYSVPLGVPLSESLGQAAAIPRAGFFVGDSRARSSNLPVYGTATLEGVPKAGIRSILNDDILSEKAPPPARADWFGGDNAGDNGGGESAATTEDESEAPKPRASNNPRTDSYGAGTYPAYPSDTRYAPQATYDAGYQAPSSSHYSPYAPPTDRRYAAPSRQAPESNGHWQASPASAYAAYGSAPKPQTEFYRREEPRQHFGGQVARQDHNFPPQKPSPASYDRPSYPVDTHPAPLAFPHDPHRVPPPPPASAPPPLNPWPPAR